MTRELLTYASRLAFVTVACGACSLLPDTPTTVKTLINAHAFYEDAYEAACVKKIGPPSCAVVASELRAWKADTIKATNELKGGGKISLRLAQLKAHQRAVARGLK